MRRHGSIAAWILAGTVFAVSVVSTNLTGLGAPYSLTYDEVALPRLAAGLVGLTAAWVVLASMVRGGLRLAWDPIATCLIALAGWATLSGAFAGTTTVWLGQSERLEGVVAVWMYAAAYIAGLQVGGSRRALRMLCIAVVSAAVVLSVHGELQAFGLDPTDYSISGYSLYLGTAFASLGNPNFLASHLVLALPLALGLGLTSREGWARIAWFAAAALITVTLYETYSQGAWLAALIQLAAFVALLLRRRQGANGADAGAGARSVARVVGSVALILVIGVAAIVGVTTIAKHEGNRLWGASLAESGSARILLLRTTVAAVADRPLLGFGPGNFLAAFRLHHPDRYNEEFGEISTNSNAHFWIAQYAATLGVPGALLLMAALALGLFRTTPFSSGPEDSRLDMLRAAAWISALGFVAQLMFNVSMIASTVPFWILFGAIGSTVAWRIEARASLARVGFVAAVVLALVAVVGSPVLLIADSTFLRSRLVFNGLTPGDDLALARKAATLNPWSVKYARACAQCATARVLEVADGSVGDAQVRSRLAVALQEFDGALARSPHDYATWSWRAGLLATAGLRLADAELAEEARLSASRAAELDRDHAEMVPLLEHGPTDGAVQAALMTPGLP